MNLGEEVDLEDYVGRPDKVNNAEIAAICQEAGMQAVRKNRCAAVPCLAAARRAVHALQARGQRGPCPSRIARVVESPRQICCSSMWTLQAVGFAGASTYPSLPKTEGA